MIYTGDNLREISFPIGGIGSGSFGITGNGRFTDWEILNRPAKGKDFGYSHIALRARTKDGKCIIKMLNGDLSKDLLGTYDRGMPHGYGFGPATGTMAGLPHFKNVEFEGEFPIAKLTFWDDDFPGKVILTAFNPFIPLDSENSSIPAGFFDIEIENATDDEIEYSAFLTMTNPFDESINEALTVEGKQIIKLTTAIDKDDVKYGDISIVSDSNHTCAQKYWYRSDWMDRLDVFVEEILTQKDLRNRDYEGTYKGDTATLQADINISANTSDHVKFVISWSAPNAHNYWSKYESKPWKNYYATVYASSIDSALYSINNFDSLYKRTLAFKNALFDTSIDKTVIDAISATMSVLKTATVMRLEDGSFYGWEGLTESDGCCEGTCQHVWTYAYALCFLFPDLERSIRENEFKYSMFDNGKTVFRMSLPLGAQKVESRACLDGQMGIVFKTYREWKISGKTDWLKSVWSNVKKVIAYAWSEENDHRWDFDKDGVLEGRQHHTLDMELFGPSAWLEGMYLCALRAGKEMADFLGDTEAASEYEALYKKGYEWTKDNLFNGEYFIQKVNLNDHSFIDTYNCPEYWFDEAGELKYQISDGCAIDQTLGQWHSNILGLGEIFDKNQLHTALKTLYKNNFVSMRDIINTWRVFSLNDEKGAIICSFPKSKPQMPLPYHVETMTGFEYALAGLMISEGMEEEGLEIVKAIRDRYDGKKRNPWNEVECGSNYARAMASYSLLPIYSGFKFDLPNKMIGFDPIHKENFKSFFSVGTAWGTVSWTEDKVCINIEEGHLDLNKLAVDVDAVSVLADNTPIDFTNNDGIIGFSDVIINNNLVVML